MPEPRKQPFEIVNEIGYEAYLKIAKNIEAHDSTFDDAFSAIVMACTVCLANALGPGIEASKNRAAAADALISSCMKRVREFVEPAVSGPS